jgi:hypothetical protein
MRQGLLATTWAGMLLFGLINFVVFSTIPSYAPRVPVIQIGIIYLLVISSMAAGIYYLTNSPGIPAGMVLGFVILSLASEGSCTLLTSPGPNYAWINGAFLYVLALGIGLVGVVIETIVERRR